MKSTKSLPPGGSETPVRMSTALMEELERVSMDSLKALGRLLMDLLVGESALTALEVLALLPTVLIEALQRVLVRKKFDA